MLSVIAARLAAFAASLMARGFVKEALALAQNRKVQVGVVSGLLFAGGYWRGSATATQHYQQVIEEQVAANAKATKLEQARQAKAAETIKTQAAKDYEAAMSAVSKNVKRKEAYIADLSKRVAGSSGCNLSSADIKRLHQLARGAD